MRCPAGAGRRVFVGRGRQLAELRGGLDQALASRGRLFLVSGEPGVGKTRLLEEVANLAAERDALAIWGRSREGEGAAPFWPWMQVIRAAIRALEPAARPEIPERLGQLFADEAAPAAERPSEDSEHARFHLFDAVTRLLLGVALTRPLVILLDDLHDADEPSLHLLEFLAAELREARILAVGTYRDVGAARTPRVAAILGELAREAAVLTLRGLDVAEAERFMAETAERTPAASLVERVHEATGGNPFFLSELVRLLASEGGPGTWAEAAPRRLPLPNGVRATVRRRLAGAAATRDVLEWASVIGREFDVGLLSGATGLARESVLERLDEAVAFGVAEKVPEAVGTYRFAHALVREALHEDLAAARRVEMHRTIGRAIEEIVGSAPGARLPELAHHFFEAAAGGEADKALDYAERAGERAMATLAYEEAVLHFERARRLLDEVGNAGATRRYEVLLALGEARKRAGEIEAAKEAFQAAVETAEAVCSPEFVARAALAYPMTFAGISSSPGMVDDLLVRWLRSAIDSLPEHEIELRAGLLARLAAETYFEPGSLDRLALTAEAVRLAREAGSLPVLAKVLASRHYALFGPGLAEERRAIADEIVRIAEWTGNRDFLMSGQSLRIVDLFELGDREALDLELARLARLAAELREPRCRWLSGVYRAARALLSGDFERGEIMAREALRAGALAGEANAPMIFDIQMLAVRREQGRLRELVEPFRTYAAEIASMPAFRCTLAWIHAQLGNDADARRLIAPLAASDFADLPRDLTWLTVVPMLAETYDRVGDAAAARVLYDLLEPFAAYHVLIGPCAACLGSVSRYLGLLARQIGEPTRAVEHFRKALEMDGWMGAEPFAARTRYELGRTLCETGERARGLPLLEEALATARQLAMKVLAAEVEAAKDTRDDGEKRRAGAASSGGRSVFRREGALWTIVYRDRSFRLPDSNGLRYVAELLHHPDEQLSAVDLAALGRGREIAGSVAGRGNLPESSVLRAGFGDAGEFLDARSRREIAVRLRELRAELEEARSFNDPGRIDRLEEETELLARELSRAVGLGGKARRAGSAGERARLNVTLSIRSALRRIAAEYRPLAEHLEATVRTGTFCCYRPDPRAPISWDS